MKNEEKPELVFADLPEGRTFRTLQYPITQALVNQYMEIIGDRNPLYLEASTAGKTSPGAPLAPPGLAAIYARLSYLQDYSMPSGGVLAKQEFDFVGPLRIGDDLQVKAKVVASHLDQKQRKRVAFQIEARNPSGDLVSVIRLEAIWPK